MLLPVEVMSQFAVLDESNQADGSRCRSVRSSAPRTTPGSGRHPRAGSLCWAPRRRRPSPRPCGALGGLTRETKTARVSSTRRPGEHDHCAVLEGMVRCPATMLGSAVDQHERQTASLRLAEPVAALSLATDLGMGQPMDSVLLSAVLGVRLASLFGVSDAELSEVYYVALLRFVGCNADAHVAAETFGDELVAREHFAKADFGRPTSVLATLMRHLGADQPPARRVRTLLTAFANMPRLYGTAVAHCEVGQLLADRLGFERGIHDALYQIFERWDGKGHADAPAW